MNRHFLIKTFLSNTQSSSFQHGNVYAEYASDEQKKVFQGDFRRRLWELAYRYSEPVSEEDHIKTIEDFAAQLSQSHPNALANQRLRIGTSQKAVNLFLKFLWCIDLIPEPLHCPIDRNVLTELGDQRNWTEIDDIQAYREIIQSIRQRAGAQTPSKWEYDLWNRKAQPITGANAG